MPESKNARPLPRVLDLWLNNSKAANYRMSDDDRIDWVRCVPFIAIHLACFGVLWVGASWLAVTVAVAFYFMRMFLITAFYHRYFSHRTFKTSRWFQCVAAFMGCTAGQRGPLWWAAHHRHHHRYSDQEDDRHSPRQRGFLWSHTGWFMTRGNFATDRRYVRDWVKFPELRFLDRFDWLPFLIFLASHYVIGSLLAAFAPSLGTNGPQLLVWGLISTVLVYHLTYTINSLAHRVGRRRYRTGDDSRNNFVLAILTLGEGWHNNHHYWPASTRQGFFWWEIDISYYVLRVMSWFGLVWGLRPVPRKVLREAHPDRIPAATATARPAVTTAVHSGGPA